MRGKLFYILLPVLAAALVNASYMDDLIDNNPLDFDTVNIVDADDPDHNILANVYYYSMRFGFLLLPFLTFGIFIVGILIVIILFKIIYTVAKNAF